MRNEDGALGRVIFSFRRPPHSQENMPSGSKGSLGERRGKNVSLPSWRIVISSEAEKSSLQTAQRCVLENGKTLHQGIVSAKRHVGCIPLYKKDFSLSLEMTIREMRYPHPTSAPSGHLLPEEGGSVHASPFPWKGLPSAARRGWLSFWRRSRLLFAFPIGEGGPRQRWIGYSRKRRT